MISNGEINYLIGKAKKEIAEDAEIVFAAHALRKTGRMARGIRSEAQAADGDVLVLVEAKNPTDGFDYVGVTRFGHRTAYIRPRADRIEGDASVISTKAERGTRQRGNAALRFEYRGRVVYARSTKGFHPAGDWADAAIPEVQAAAQQAIRRLGRNVQDRWSR